VAEAYANAGAEVHIVSESRDIEEEAAAGAASVLRAEVLSSDVCIGSMLSIKSVA
jgi:NAD(P)-dependent dehydrogenase (short-subunit alcohol dehydrogenase family)